MDLLIDQLVSSVRDPCVGDLAVGVSLQAHLVEGVIDQVDSTVQVSWVQPRVLSVPQVAALRTRLDSWLDRVHSTLLSVEAETPELLAS